MPGKISKTPNSKKAYYFGLVSLILFGVQGALKWSKAVNAHNSTKAKLPDFLLWTTLLLLLFTASLCIINGIRSIKEQTNLKKMVGLILAIGSIAYIIFIARDVVVKVLG